MRRVEIIQEPTGVRRWVAIEYATQKPLLRIASSDQLYSLCDRLGWQVETKRRQSRQSNSLSRRA